MAKAVANAYSKLTVGCLLSIVREFWTRQWRFVLTSVLSDWLKEETQIFSVPSKPEAELVGTGN